jgi:hypothetical protein
MAYDMHLTDATGHFDETPLCQIEFAEHEELRQLLQAQPSRFPMTSRLQDACKDAVIHHSELAQFCDELIQLSSATTSKTLPALLKSIRDGARAALRARKNIAFLAD